MNRRPLLLLLGAAILAPTSTSAQQPVDGPGGRFDDDLLSKLEGAWLITRQMHARTEQNTLNVTWELSHQFLQLHMKDTAIPSRYEAIVLIGFIHASGEYVAHWTDTFGGMYSAIGKGKRLGNSVEFRFEYPTGRSSTGSPGTLNPVPGKCGWKVRTHRASVPSSRWTPCAGQSDCRHAQPERCIANCKSVKAHSL